MSDVRVALVAPGLIGGKHGGVERVASWLFDRLDAEPGYQPHLVSIATSAADPHSSHVRSPRTWLRGPSVHRTSIDDVTVTHVGTHLAEIEVLRYSPRAALSAVLREFDLIQVVSGTPAFGSAVPNIGAPMCLQVATTVRSERGRIAVHRPVDAYRTATAAAATSLERRAVRRADHTFVENHWMLETVRAWRGSTATLAPPGIDTDKFCPAEGWEQQDYILSVGRLDSQRKNFAGLIDAYSDARNRGLDNRLVVAGGGRVPEELRDRVRALGLSTVVDFEESVSEMRLLDLYRGARLFALASREEGLGLVFLEALACGVPVVSTLNHGAREIFSRGAVGELAKDTGAGALGSLLLRWTDLGRDREVRERARRFAVSEFGNKVAGDRFIDVYRGLVNG